MEAKLKNLKTFEEKRDFLKSQQFSDTSTELVYLAISRDKDQDNYKLLDWALDNNLCNLIPTSHKVQFDKKTLDNLFSNCQDFSLYGVYCRHIKSYFETKDKNSFQSNSQYKILMKSLGEYTDKLMVIARKETDFQGRLYQGQKNGFQGESKGSQIIYLVVRWQAKQSLVIDLIITLTPEYLQLNPEVFQIILLSFTNGLSPDDHNSQQLDMLAKTIKNQCNAEDNMNNDHDWMMLFSALFEQVYHGEGIGMYFILKNISLEILCQIIISNQQYLLLNYFNNSESALKILTGLTEHYVNPQNIEIIQQVSNILKNQVVVNQSQIHLQILKDIYHKFILTRILSNIQMYQVNKELRELLEFYIVGISSIEPQFPLDCIELMSKRLTMLLNIKFQSKDFTKSTFEFIETIKTFYPNLQNNTDLLAIQKNCQQKSKEIIRVSNLMQKQYLIWQVDQNTLKGNSMGFQLLQKDRSQYVGLENLGNTCFMNSFIQSLFMNQQFRDIILQLKMSMETSIFFSEKQSFLSSLQKVFMLLTYQKQGYSSPYQLKRSLRAPYGDCFDQQDVSEFGLHFLEDLYEVLPKKEAKILESLFMGYYQSKMSCGNCHNINKKAQEKFIGLSLHFKHKSRESINLNKDLKNMIREFFDPEQLDFQCQQCKKSSAQSTNQNQLISLPPFLMLTLQRFTYDVKEQRKTKMLDKVMFEFSIDMRDVFPNLRIPDNDSFKYDLYAFIVHLGQSSDSGHYITYARQIDKDPLTWMTFDDNFILSQSVKGPQFFDDQLIDQETPYLLFYRNKTSQQCDFTQINLK